ncbi:hypothetical protein MtrunA17_Chr7g0272031 [Medicago truncatula]|uniref:Transmembrane protein n=1 Tax=Medicago truncatula TaxID=3880 RepID=A0A396H7H9_MEDTR|nr:hypothetical protein MtrunA17_Chr7g0272031 [Medicago truncatula]
MLLQTVFFLLLNLAPVSLLLSGLQKSRKLQSSHQLSQTFKVNLKNIHLLKNNSLGILTIRVLIVKLKTPELLHTISLDTKTCIKEEEEPYCYYKESHVQESVNICKNNLIGKILSEKHILHIFSIVL